MQQFKCTGCGAVETLRFYPDCCSYCRGYLARIDNDTTQDSAKFDFISTPNEAWLLVSQSALDTVNIDPDQLSHTSLRSRAKIYALAEVEDAIAFMDRWQARFGIINIRENVVAPNVISDWPSVQPHLQASVS